MGGRPAGAGVGKAVGGPRQAAFAEPGGSEERAFPAAATTSAPLPIAYEIASRIAGSGKFEPTERLITRAPWSAAHVTPSAMFDVVPDPFEPMALTGRILHWPQTPGTPMLLLLRAAITPATSVPCPKSSAAFAVPAITFQPGRTAPARPGFVASTPLPTTATTTLLEPVEAFHASGRWMFAD